jgi:hypothetical protein
MYQRLSFACRVASVAVGVLLLMTCAACGAPRNSEHPGAASAATASPFGPLVSTFNSMDTYQRHLSFSTNPLVLFLFDHDPQAILQFWQPLISGFSQAMEKFGIDVADVAASSEVGQQLQQALGGGTAILFYQGVGDTPVNGEKGLKVPIAYEGAADVVSLTKWALSCVSAAVVQRVHNDADLVRFFSLYPQYPTLPHVLFFPSKNFTHAGFLAVSQHFSYDAGFAVVPDAFAEAAEEDEGRAAGGGDGSTAIARRYGIQNATELPALLVLHKASAEDGGVGESDYAVWMNSSVWEWSYSGVRAFLEQQLNDTIAALVARAEATQNPRVLAAAEARRKYMAAALVERQQHIVEEERLRMAAEPVVVANQAAWTQHCLQLPKGHKCLVAFVDSTQDPDAQSNAVRILSSVSLKLMELLAMEARSISLVIVEREGSDALREYFDAGQNGFPDVVLISLSRPAKYYNFVGSFSAESMVHFVTSHDPRFAKEEVRGGHVFIPRMVPKLESRAAGDRASKDDDEGDL